MYYGGHDQSYGGNQGYAGGLDGNMQDYNYPQQQMMPRQEPGGYHQYGQQGAYAQPGMMNGVAGDGHGGCSYDNGYAQPDGNDGRMTALKSSKSFTGPPPGMDCMQSSAARSRPIASHSSKGGGTGLARNGSVFVGGRERDTQVSISTRGGMSVHAIGGTEDEELKQYYGDMARRNDERRMDGVKAIRSYRGDIEDGEDVGKPRRVTNRRNVDGRSATGYGGINFKRKAAMRNGEQWGDVEVRSNFKGGGGTSLNMNQFYGQQPMYGSGMHTAPVGFEESPVMPQIYSKEDVHSYSNMSDAFSEDDQDAQEDVEY
ncbi:hypothetical protein Q4I30_007195 [Leishmania utingensis]|uniref:Uncharacterized protein n=1 Tax=Leishmania utingensis TaxID=653362 RepID=A0AAW3A253_9TRYP